MCSYSVCDTMYQSKETLEHFQTLNVNSLVADHVHFVVGHQQKSLVIVKSLKCVKDISCVDKWSFVQSVTNVPVAAPDLPEGARLHQFWETWATLGSSPKVIRIVREDREVQNGKNGNKDITSIRGVDDIYRLQACLHPHSNTHNPGNTTFKVNPINSKHYLLVCPQHPWNSW